MTRETQKNINYTLSTLAIEGLTPSKETVKLCEKMSDGEIELEDVLFAIRKKYNLGDSKRVQ